MEIYNQELKVKTIRMTTELSEQIEKLAKQNERDFSSQVRYMLRRYIDITKNQ